VISGWARHPVSGPACVISGAASGLARLA